MSNENPNRPIAIYGPPGGQVRLESGDGHFIAYDDVDKGRYPFPDMPKAFTALNCFVEKRGQKDVPMEGYEWYGRRFPAPGDPDATPETTCPADPKNDWFLLPTDTSHNPNWWQMPLLVPTALFLSEAGRWTTNERAFFNEQGQPARWWFVSMFLLFARQLNGENIDAQVAWCAKHGFGMRVFGAVNWDQMGLYGLPDYSHPQNRPDWEAQLRTFFGKLAAAGVRCEYTVLTFQEDMLAMRSHLQRVYDVAQSYPLVMVEGGNEVENNGIDIIQVYQGIDRHGVLSAYGNDPARGDYNTWSTDPNVQPKDYGTTHDLIRDFNHSSRNSKDVWEMQQAFQRPFVLDEPVGFLDAGYPNFHELYRDEMNEPWYSWNGGGGIRTGNVDVVLSNAAISLLLTPGYTFHMQVGLEGRVPNSGQPKTQQTAERLAAIRRFIPPEAQLGQYRAPHIADFPFQWTDADSRCGHAYASVLGGTAWAVNPVPRAGWKGFVGQNGWALDAIGPEPYIARFTR